MTSPDLRIVNGARCTWWDSIDKIGIKQFDLGHVITGTGLPVCPFCRGVLFETDTIEQWWSDVDRHDAKSPGYRALIEFGRGKCFLSWAMLETAFAERPARQDGERATS